MREKARRGERTFALTADVKEAHRQIPVARGDWRLLGCRVRPGTCVCVNTVGTFGISSASYYWSRVGSGIGRLTQGVVGSSATIWIMLVADDYHLETSGAAYRTGLIYHFLRHLFASRSPAFEGEDVWWGNPHMGRIRAAPQDLPIGYFPTQG